MDMVIVKVVFPGSEEEIWITGTLTFLPLFQIYLSLLDRFDICIYIIKVVHYNVVVLHSLE